MTVTSLPPGTGKGRVSLFALYRNRRRQTHGFHAIAGRRFAIFAMSRYASLEVCTRSVPSGCRVARPPEKDRESGRNSESPPTRSLLAHRSGVRSGSPFAKSCPYITPGRWTSLRQYRFESGGEIGSLPRGQAPPMTKSAEGTAYAGPLSIGEQSRHIIKEDPGLHPDGGRERRPISQNQRVMVVLVLFFLK
jgi:hypothetical protein